MRNFKGLKIWQLGMQVTTDCFRLCTDFPTAEKFGLRSQMTRAAISIPSNIAEGSSRSSQKEYIHFIDISIGSCYELETQALLAKTLNLGNQELADQMLDRLVLLQKMLFTFRIRLKTSLGSKQP